MYLSRCAPGFVLVFPLCLQHMEQTYGFECGSLKVLVLDEADRIMDMGFKRELHAILENLPATKQTLLFSATQTKEVCSLVALSLRPDAEYIAVHENEAVATPISLTQHFIKVDVGIKIRSGRAAAGLSRFVTLFTESS
jgi:ATP-dependent RNA helicase DDX10/DBP4